MHEYCISMISILTCLLSKSFYPFQIHGVSFIITCLHLCTYERIQPTESI